MKLAAIAAGLLALPLTTMCVAQSSRSLTDSDNGLLFAQGAVNTASFLDEDTPQSYEALQERVILLRSTIKALTDSLAISNSEAEVFKRQTAEQQLRLEALGIATIQGNQAQVEQRLISAVRDLRLLKKQNDAAINQLVRLTEAVELMIKSVDGLDPHLRMTVETELRKTNEILSNPEGRELPTVEATLNDGSVIDVKEDLSLVIANVGEKQGAKIGMPFQVLRDNKVIGSVRIIDVRERIAGAIIQNLESEEQPIKVGDRLKVDARP